MGFEPRRAEPNGLAVHRLNHYSSESMRRKMRVCKICAILRFWEVRSFSSFLALQTSLVCCIID